MSEELVLLFSFWFHVNVDLVIGALGGDHLLTESLAEEELVEVCIVFSESFHFLEVSLPVFLKL